MRNWIENLLRPNKRTKVDLSLRRKNSEEQLKEIKSKVCKEQTYEDLKNWSEKEKKILILSKVCNKQTNRQTYESRSTSETNRQTNISNIRSKSVCQKQCWSHFETKRQTNRQIDTQTNRQTDKQIKNG